MGAFKEPHGGKLQELYLTESAAEQEKIAARDYPSWNLTDRQLCDLELLLNGAFSPLDGFLGSRRLRIGALLHATGEQAGVADPDQPRRVGGIRRRPCTKATALHCATRKAC